MGYSVWQTTKEQLVDEIKRDNRDVLDWSLVGNNLWGIVPVSNITIERSEKFKDGDCFIILYKIESFGGGEWGYKVMDEGMHPYYYSCPKKFLKKAVVLSSEWREGVMSYHAKKAHSRTVRFDVGDVIGLVGCSIKQVEITSVKPLLGIDVATGKQYRIPKKFIAA